MIIENQMIRDLTKFTHSTYIKLLNKLRNKYLIIPFYQISETDKPYIILRHDIDASLDLALEMAIIENNIDIKSTYFVLFSHKLYNILEKDSLETLRKISNLGHEIGLHYDIEAYVEYRKNPFKVLEQEIQLLGTIICRKVVSVAPHNPSMISMEDPLHNSKYINAYDRSLYDLYVSDSCRAWNLADLSNMLSFKYRKCQLLIHPFLWTKNICKREDLLEDFFHRIKVKSDATKEEWMKLWNDQSKVKKYDKSIKE